MPTSAPDRGIPLPGTKGASLHVASVCRELERAGLEGKIYSTRALDRTIGGVSIVPIDTGLAGDELGQFLTGMRSPSFIESGCEFVYERYSMWHTGGLARARELGVPFILEVNSPLPLEARRFRSLEHETLAIGVAELLMRHADAVVCVSDNVARWVIAQRGGKKGVRVVPNGVDPEIFNPEVDSRSPTGWPRIRGPVVAFSGAFRPWHGLEGLLEGFRILITENVPEAHLLLVGDGPLRAALEARARELGFEDRLHVTGHMDQAEVPHWLAGADVAVAPYPDLEDFYYSPLKLYEFLAQALPIVASDIGQVREILDGGRHGFLCAPGDARGLASTLARALGEPREARRRASEGRRWVLAKATWSARVAEILELVTELGRQPACSRAES